MKTEEEFLVRYKDSWMIGHFDIIFDDVNDKEYILFISIVDDVEIGLDSLDEIYELEQDTIPRRKDSEDIADLFTLDDIFG